MTHKLTDEEVISAIYEEMDRSVDFANTTLRENRARSWNYYLNRQRGDEVEGRSRVQDTSVRDTVHALLATIMPGYASDNIISFEPSGPDDLDQSEAESSAVNNLFTETNRGYLQLYNAVFDALLFRNGIIKVWIEELEKVVHRAFDAPPDAVLAAAPDDEEWTFVETDDNGLSHFKVKAMGQNLRTEAVEQAYFYTDPNQQDQDLRNADFMFELVFLTRSELLERGISRQIVDALPSTPDETNVTDVGGSRQDIIAKFIEGAVDYSEPTTPDRETIECYWAHMLIDKDGDGISERWRFLVSARQILEEDPVDFFPYASGSCWPVSHRWSGLSVYDLERITQDEMTNARRQLADNMNFANNQRPVYDPGETSPEDITNGAPGRGIRSSNPGNVQWMPFGDMVSNSLAFLQYMGEVRGEQTGAALAMQSAEGQIVREAGALSVGMQLAPREQMAALCSRNLAETLVRDTFLLIHETLRTQWTNPIMFQKSGDWQGTIPTTWRPRTRINVVVGLSPGERRNKASALQQVIQMQLSMIQGGTANITATWNGVHSAISDWMKMSELDSADGYFLDPDGQESQAGQQQQAQNQQQLQAQQAQQQQQADAAMQAQLTALGEGIKQEWQKIRDDMQQWKAELQHDYFSDILDAESGDVKIESEERRTAAEITARAAAEGAANGNGADR